MFKPGDRVVRTGPTATWKGERCVHGETYTVDQVTEAGNLGLEGLPGSWTGRYFTLAWRDGPAPSPVDPEAWDPYIVMMVEGIDSSDGGAWGAEVVLALLCFLRHFRVAYGTRPPANTESRREFAAGIADYVMTCHINGSRLTPHEAATEAVLVILSDQGAWANACDVVGLPPHPYKGGEA